MVDVIIPAYNAHGTIERALQSLIQQINKEVIKVYIINDGSDTDYSNIVNCYSEELDIEQITIKNSGPGFARQKGLNCSHNEYILFLDADDYLYDEYALINLLHVIKGNDVAEGRFVEKKVDGDVILNPQYCYLHGKIFRRSIIEKNKLRFDVRKKNTGDIYEDSSFNQLYYFCCDSVGTTNKIVYVYEYNSESLTKKNIDAVANLHNFIDAMNWLTHEVKKRNLESANIVWNYCLMCFHCYFHYLLSPEANEFVFKEMKQIKKIYKKYENEISYDNQLAIYKLFDFPVIPTITFYDFMDKCEG